MSTFVGIPPFSNPLAVAMETMHFHIAHNNLFLGHLRFAFWGPNKQFGTHENCPGGMQGSLNWMPG